MEGLNKTDDRTADDARDDGADETKGGEVPVASAIAAGYDAALENLGRVMTTGIPPPPPDGDQVAVLSHRIAQGTNLAAQKREEVAQLEAQIADAIGEDEARALFSTIATEPSDFLADKRRLVREAAQAQQAANNAEADVAQAKQLLDDIHLTVPELKALMVERERELHNKMETQFEVMRKEMESRLAAMEAMESRLAAMENGMAEIWIQWDGGHKPFPPHTQYRYESSRGGGRFRPDGHAATPGGVAAPRSPFTNSR